MSNYSDLIEPLKVSVVTVTYNNVTHIPNLLASLEKYVIGRHQAIIIDNASTDGSRDLLRMAHKDIVVILCEENLGFGGANNIAFERCNGDIIFLLNSDAWFVGPTIEQVSRYCTRRPNVGIVGVPLVFPDGSPQRFAYGRASPLKWTVQALGLDVLLRSYLMERDARMRRAGKPATSPPPRSDLTVGADRHLSSEDVRVHGQQVDWICGAAMVIRKDLLIDVGGFDSGLFMYSEDEDLCIRAKAAGYSVEAVSAMLVVHEFGWGKKKHSENYLYLRTVSNRYFVNKHFSGKSLICWYMLLLIPLRLGGIRGVFWWIRNRRNILAAEQKIRQMSCSPGNPER